jgi:serine phosphatase RsbU (regulator of sigma subunit)
MTEGGPVIGLFEGCAYEQGSIEIRSGDLLLAYTDGLTEALNLAGEEFGEERLQEVITQAAQLSAEEIRGSVVRCVQSWCAGAPQHDDLTLIVVKVK